MVESGCLFLSQDFRRCLLKCLEFVLVAAADCLRLGVTCLGVVALWRFLAEEH